MGVNKWLRFALNVKRNLREAQKPGFARNARKSIGKRLMRSNVKSTAINLWSNANGAGGFLPEKKNEKKCEACRKEGRYGSPQMVAHSKREPPKVSINGVLKIADKDGTTYGKAVLAHNI